MKFLVALLAWLMPVVAWLSNTGVFGPTNGEISDQYPTLIVAAGYAFAIWGPIFLLDVIYGTWQLFDSRENTRGRVVRPYSAIAFAMTSAWMIVFSLQLFWLALAIIWVSLACVWYAAWRFSNGTRHARSRWWESVPLSLHAGWVSLAAFLNVAQVIVAFQLFSTTHMLPWTLVLFVLVAVLLLVSIVRLRGSVWYALAAVWGLVGVYVKQSGADLRGAQTAAWIALALAVIVAVASVVVTWRQKVATGPI
ncbi:MAG TPA: hypothetical protein VFJ15_09185 [Oleiagrimonas sp.]|nr:hypothetical protein [Oleiagrimonas sp.]